jgi:ribosomal protein S18 acetylase RimI-like enzyme
MGERGGQSGSQSEFGSPIRIRLTTDRDERCRNGHLIAVGGGSGGYHHLYELRDRTCNVCYGLGLPGHTWALLDPAEQYPVDATPRQALRLVIRPPVAAVPRSRVRAGVGTIALVFERAVVGEVGVSLCQVERRGVIEHVKVDPACRRRGYGRALIAAALTRGPGYTWSTASIGEHVEARAFWSALDPREPLALGVPAYCSHMIAANGVQNGGRDVAR